MALWVEIMSLNVRFTRSNGSKSRTAQFSRIWVRSSTVAKTRVDEEIGGELAAEVVAPKVRGVEDAIIGSNVLFETNQRV